MSDLSLYKRLWCGQHSEIKSIADDVRNETCIRALAYVAVSDLRLAKEILRHISDDQLESGDNICLEAQLAILARVGEKPANLKKKAEEILSKNTNATLVAHTVLGYLAEQEKNYRTALEHYESILSACPTHINTLANVARTLISSGQPSNALPLLKHLRSRETMNKLTQRQKVHWWLIALVYDYAARMKRLEGILIAIGILLLIVFSPLAVYIYWCLILICVLGAAYFLTKDRYATAVLVLVALETTIALILHFSYAWFFKLF
jgi:tetratricopeptide (TPR) repeat protein